MVANRHGKTYNKNVTIRSSSQLILALSYIRVRFWRMAELLYIIRELVGQAERKV